MILTCPSCSTRYLADAASFQPAGRTVRCANCGHSWFQEPPKDAPKKVLLDTPSPGPSGTLALDDTPQLKSDGGRVMRWAKRLSGWAVLILALAALAIGAYQYRVEIVRGWPQAASLYKSLGVDLNVRGLEFRNVQSSFTTQAGLRVLEIKGDIVNISETSQPIPRVRVTLRDENEKPLYSWTFAVSQTRLGSSAATGFETRLSSPPADARDVEIVFDLGATGADEDTAPDTEL